MADSSNDGSKDVKESSGSASSNQGGDQSGGQADNNPDSPRDPFYGTKYFGKQSQAHLNPGPSTETGYGDPTSGAFSELEPIPLASSGHGSKFEPNDYLTSGDAYGDLSAYPSAGSTTSTYESSSTIGASSTYEDYPRQYNDSAGSTNLKSPDYPYEDLSVTSFGNPSTDSLGDLSSPLYDSLPGYSRGDTSSSAYETSYSGPYGGDYGGSYGDSYSGSYGSSGPGNSY